MARVNRAKFINGSYGNGAAMRAPILAMCYLDDKISLKESVLKSSEITHAHPLAIEGAQLIAFVTHAALHSWKNKEIISELPSWCNSKKYQEKITFFVESIKTNKPLKCKSLKTNLGNSITALDSSVTAIYFALQYREKDFQAMLSKIYSLGGDTDTIGAMAGSIWGAFNGSTSINIDSIQKIENPSNIINLANQLYKLSSRKNI